MPVIRISLNDMQYKNLTAAAAEEGISIQDYIRHQIFKDEAWFKPSDAVEMALTKYHPDELFTLPELYGEEWKVPRGFAGAIGKQFYAYVLNHCAGKIEFVGMTDYNRHAQYRIIPKPKFEPEEAVELALKKYHHGDLFTLPKVYGTDWMTKMASVDSTFAKHFGQSFQRYVLKYCIDTIKDIDEKADGVELYQVI